ncbi:hypothetical protein Tsubulata_036279 [Turnera subulata]|uniref:Uncharacterized protein n=1 Tax=Turnera subulata TaxID=218843 RepID=A0A9Q0GHV0_9ROSI|nr:hypothetical protein Tsubulata_036279 [Turnera subulata]
MALARRFQTIRELYRAVNVGESSHLLGSSRSYSTGFSNATRVNSWGGSSWYYKGQNALPWTDGSTMTLRSTMAIDLPIFASDKRLATTQVKAPPQARQMGALKLSISSPGFIYEPYGPRDKISFWKRLAGC